MKNRLFAVILTAMVAVSMTVPAFVEAVYAVDGQEQDVQNEQLAVEPENPTGEEPLVENTEGEDESAEIPEEGKLKSAGVAAGSIDITVKKNPNGSVELSWGKVDGALSYAVYSSEYNEGMAEKVNANASEAPKTVLNRLTEDKEYSFTVDAHENTDGNGKILATGTKTFKTYKITFDESTFRKLSGTVGSGAGNLGVNLRTMIGEGNGGYAVAQGSACDGEFMYHMLASSSNQKGRIVKTTRSGAYVASSGVLDIHHANGMTYDKKRNKLVCVGYGDWRKELTFIDPVTFATSKDTIKYPYDIDGVTDDSKENGLGAIAYVEKYNVYVARSRGRNNGVGDSNFNNDIWVINADNLNVIGHVFTRVSSAYPETYQSMDADEKYVYYLLSPGSGQSGNIILCLDWNSENLLPVVNGEKDFVEYTWKCNNDGAPDAVIRIPISHESEGLCHYTSSDGKAHFYVTEYYGRQHYKTVTKKVVKSKKKWKKVRKWYNKKTKKWTTKKPKKKYRGKSKKVWKYKYKYKTVKVKKKDYWARDDYVYDLGVI